jgi:hypothetical protein
LAYRRIRQNLAGLTDHDDTALLAAAAAQLA